MMSIEQWLEQYGYWAVFCGVMLEGPVTLTLAGFLAHQGYLNSAGVLLAAAAGIFLAIEFFFFLGRLLGRRLLAQWAAWGKYQLRFAALLDRHRLWFLLGFRFIYGGHTLAPMAIGATPISPARFTVINAAGALLWLGIYFPIGYFFGHAFEMLVEDLKRHEISILLGLAAAVLLYYLVRRFMFRRGAAHAPAAGDAAGERRVQGSRL